MTTNLQNDCELLIKQDGLNLYATLSIFTAKAPRLIDCIVNAIKEENLTELEDLATKLILYSDNAHLNGFSERVKNLIIAVREHKISMAETLAESLKQCLRQMTETTCAIV